MGQTRLGRLFIIRVLQLILQWIDYRLEGGGEVFCRVLRFSLRQHVLVLYCGCISLPLLLCFTFIVLCSCLCTRVDLVIALHLLLFQTQINQSKSNLAIIFNWRFKQTLGFQHKSELSVLFCHCDCGSNVIFIQIFLFCFGSNIMFQIQFIFWFLL